MSWARVVLPTPAAPTSRIACGIRPRTMAAMAVLAAG